MQRDPATLTDMLRACRLVLEFRKGLDRSAFHRNVEKQSSIMHQLMVLGEAAKRLSMEFRDAHPQLPWADIAGMRDRLIHGYDQIDLDLVWEATETGVPALTRFLEPLVPQPEN